MKLLRTLLVLALVVATVLGTAGPALASTGKFTDTVGTRYDGAANRLADLDIARGMTPANFGPDRLVKRSELAAFIIRSLGLEASANASKGETLFTDVPRTHWATGYINVASSMGLILGYQGRFRPDDNVKYSEAVTMLARALGYSDAELLALGEWPTGAITKATALGIIAGVTEFSRDQAAIRGAVALLLDNTVFRAPLKADGKTLSQSVFGLNNVASLVVTSPHAALAIGKQEQFTAKAYDASGKEIADVNVTWAVEGPAVISATGLLVAHGSGAVTVQAKLGDITGTRKVNVAGAATALKLALAGAALTDNGSTTTTLSVSAVDAAGVIANSAATVTLTIAGTARFLVDGVAVASTNVTLVGGVGTVSLRGTGNQAAGNAQLTATSPGLTGAILGLTLTKPVATSVRLTVAPAVIEAKSGSTATITATLLDEHGVAINSSGTNTYVDLALSPASFGSISGDAYIAIAAGASTGTATFAATAVPGATSVSGAAVKTGAAYASATAATGLSVQAASLTSAIAGDAYQLGFDQTGYGTITAGRDLSVKVAIQDFTGVVKTTAPGTLVTVSAKLDGTTLTRTASATTVNGVATVTFTGAGRLNKTGAWSFRAESGTLKAASGASASVTPGAVHAIALRDFAPATIASNGNQQSKLVAEVLDAHGNVVTSASGVVSFARATAATYAVALPASLEAAVVNGLAELVVTATTAEATDSFNASYVSGHTTYTAPAAKQVSTKITGLANRLVISGLGAANTVAGGELTVVVDVRDAAAGGGTLVSTDNGRLVTLTVTSANAAHVTVAQGTVATVNGQATFKLSATRVLSGLTVTAASSGLLRATDVALTGTFSAGPAAKVKLSTALSAVETGTAALPVTIAAVDAYGNPALGTVAGVALRTTLGSFSGGNLVAGTASGIATITAEHGKASVDGAEVPVEGCAVTVYNAGPAHRLVIRGIADTAVTNSGANGALVTITVQDSEGRVKTSDSSTWVKLSYTDTAGAEGLYRADGTALPAHGALQVSFGSASFRVTNTLAGALQLAAADGASVADAFVAAAPGLADAAATAVFLMGPAHAITLAANPTAIAANGSSISQLTATVVDAFGNTVAFHGTLAWSIASGDGHGTLINASTSSVNGVAYNTLQSKSRDIASAVVVKAEANVAGDAANESATVSITVAP